MIDVVRGGSNMDIKEKIIKGFPLAKKIECSFDCYEALDNRFIIFYDKKIDKSNMNAMLDDFLGAVKNTDTYARSIIVVANTECQFNKKDLLFFNGDDTFVVYYLINEATNEVYYNDEHLFIMLGVGWRKVIKKINKILNIR